MLNDVILGGVGVLVLVNQNMFELSLPFCTYCRYFFKEPDGFKQKIVKVECSGCSAHIFIGGIDFSDIFLIRELSGSFKFSRSNHFVFCT
ncbi:hypothetical protein D3C73_1399390 [compost metagenome]